MVLAISSASTDAIYFIGIPLLIFVLGATGSGVVALIKFSTYLGRSQKAQESTAKSNEAILEKLDRYIEKTDGILLNYGERISVLEYAQDIRKQGYAYGRESKSQ